MLSIPCISIKPRCVYIKVDFEKIIYLFDKRKNEHILSE